MPYLKYIIFQGSLLYVCLVVGLLVWWRALHGTIIRNGRVCNMYVSPCPLSFRDRHSAINVIYGRWPKRSTQHQKRSNHHAASHQWTITIFSSECFLFATEKVHQLSWASWCVVCCLYVSHLITFDYCLSPPPLTCFSVSLGNVIRVCCSAVAVVASKSASTE